MNGCEVFICHDIRVIAIHFSSMPILWLECGTASWVRQVTDYQQFNGDLQLDVVDKEEICAGMAGRNFITRKSEDLS